MDQPPALSLRHRFVPGADPAPPPLLLLHGTGGNEDDLLPLGRALAPGAALLSPRGAVEESGMPRFFRRLAEGVFDEADLRRRTADLAGFVESAREAYGIGAPVAVGFSNGANIAASLLLLHPGVLSSAVLLRAMTPFRPAPGPSMPGTPVLLLSGATDPMVSAANAAQLAAQLTASGAHVTHRTVQAGHNLSQADLETATLWLKGLAR